MNTQRDQLLRDGFCRFEDVIPMSMIADLRAATDDLLDAMTEEERAQTGSQGAMLGLPFTPDVFCDLIALPGLIDDHAPQEVDKQPAPPVVHLGRSFETATPQPAPATSPETGPVVDQPLQGGLF